ncbi:hypothetical protein XBP1_370002 [Xenorhabdus bovienii str. puntauvense]|uniref:Uncharacterized protein n=1 Tax=Xenorhabdus bovienii str. puntauvense TaxID=1398201 RepID=A0A077NJC0_XENBV|nr:hypothetical protein XBP1_370002 [Xenorhabdus bovienii str. puntauvense]
MPGPLFPGKKSISLRGLVWKTVNAKLHTIGVIEIEDIPKSHALLRKRR